MSNIKLFSGNSVPKLAKCIADCLCTSLCNAYVGRFSDGEINVEINENVRGSDIFVIQSTCFPTNDNLMELIIITDALRRASASRITAVIPYFGYARQDRRIYSSRVPISAKIVADLLSIVKIDHVLTVELHSEQIQGFFNIPVDNISVSHLVLKDIFKLNLNNPIIVSPDVGSIKRARNIAKSLNDIDIAIIDKYRQYANNSQVMNIIGDIDHRDCILVDDMIDTGGTLYQASKVLKEKGAKRIFAYITHPVFSGKIINHLNNSLIDEIIVCDTIPLINELQSLPNIRILTLSGILAEAIRRISNSKSISEMLI